jgi:predicted RNA-binding protein YlqC (UPF0109 family)
LRELVLHPRLISHITALFDLLVLLRVEADDLDVVSAKGRMITVIRVVFFAVIDALV